MALAFFLRYKSCLPQAHRQEIQGLSRLARYQIRKTVKRFLKRLGNCQASERNLKLKYLMELSAIEPSLGTETFQGQDGGCRQSQQSYTRLIRVSGETGVQTRIDNTAVSVYILFYFTHRRHTGFN